MNTHYQVDLWATLAVNFAALTLYFIFRNLILVVFFFATSNFHFVIVKCFFFSISDNKLIPFVTIHRERKGFEHIRHDCWMKVPINVKIVHIHREEHPHRTRKAFNPNL